MELHYITLSRLARELQERFQSATIQSCYTQRKNELIIQVSPIMGPNLDLMLSTDTRFPFVLFRESQKRSKISTDVLTNLRQQIISDITIQDKDRIFEILFQNSSIKFLIQIFRNRTNFFVTDKEYTILDAFKRGNKFISTTYEFQDLAKVEAEPKSVTDFLAVIWDKPSQSLQKIIRNQYFLVNQTIIKEIEIRLSINLNQPASQISSEELHTIFNTIREILRDGKTDQPRVYSKNENPVAFALTTLRTYQGFSEKKFDLINDALKYFLFSRQKYESHHTKMKKLKLCCRIS